MLGSQAKGLVLVCYHLLYGLPPHIMHLLILLEEKGRMGKSQLLGKYANQGRCTWLLWAGVSAEVLLIGHLGGALILRRDTDKEGVGGHSVTCLHTRMETQVQDSEPTQEN